MKSYELLDAVGGIDGGFIEGAGKYKARRPLWKTAVSAAAVLAVLAGIYFAFPEQDPKPVPVSETGKSMENADAPEAYSEQPVFTEPAPDLTAESPYNGSAVFAPFNYLDISGVKPMISDYGESSFSADMSVNNGCTVFSAALDSAMEYYGDSANYRVLVVLFSDGQQVYAGGDLARKEAQRLFELGYITAMETIAQTEDDGDYVTVNAEYYFTLHASLEQLRDFPPSGELGYFFMLYNEYFGGEEDEATVAFNGIRY